MGVDWTAISGTGAIRANEFYNGDSTGGGAGVLQRHRHNTALATDDMGSEITVTGFATGGYSDARVMARWDGVNYYEVRMDSNGAAILNRVVGATETSSLHTFESGMTYSFPEVWRFEITGTNPVHLELFRDDVSVGTFDDTDPTRIQTGQLGGIGAFTSAGVGAVTIDNYSHFALGVVDAADITRSYAIALGAQSTIETTLTESQHTVTLDTSPTTTVLDVSRVPQLELT